MKNNNDDKIFDAIEVMRIYKENLKLGVPKYLDIFDEYKDSVIENAVRHKQRKDEDSWGSPLNKLLIELNDTLVFKVGDFIKSVLDNNEAEYEDNSIDGLWSFGFKEEDEETLIIRNNKIKTFYLTEPLFKFERNNVYAEPALIAKRSEYPRAQKSKKYYR